MSSVRLKLWGASFVLVACTVAGSAWLNLLRAGAAPASQPQVAGAQRIEQLRAERHEVLQLMVDAAQEHLRQGLVDSPTELQEAVLALRNAELEASKTPGERIRIHEQIVEFLRQQESQCQSLHDIGKVSVVRVQKAKANRLKAEIDLEEAKLAITAASGARPEKQ